jgi:hypothetical protein
MGFLGQLKAWGRDLQVPFFSVSKRLLRWRWFVFG